MGKCVLITGATRGIGEALLKHHAGRGDAVIAVGRRPNRGAKEPFNNVKYYTLDVADRSSVKSFLDELLSGGQFPDIVYFNAGLHDTDNDVYLDFSVFSDVIDVNMMSVFHFLSICMPRISKPCMFVYISSGSTIFPNPSCIGYFVSKLGVTKAFDHFAYRYASLGFSFKTVVLGPIQTDLLANSPRPPGLAGLLREMTTGNVDELAPRIAKFTESSGNRMYYRKSSIVIYWIARVAQWFLPSRYKLYQARVPPPEKRG